MPLHRIYAATGTFSPPEKKAIAQSITNIYNSIPIPAFYTVVVFIDVDEESIFVGGESNARFVRIVSQHLARSYSTPEASAKASFLDRENIILRLLLRELDFSKEFCVRMYVCQRAMCI